MNFHIRKGISVILMSVRRGAPYDDEIDYKKNILIYEGHDMPKTRNCPDPKKIDQPLRNSNGTVTENGKFVKAVEDFKRGLIDPEKVFVFEKLNSGIWSEKGMFSLIDYEVRESNGRKVIKFILNPLDEQIEIPRGKDDSEHTRLIPTQIKVEVWKRDKGRCVICQSTKNLHYDHDLPYSKGGSSITEKNVRILCAKCNLKKHDKIE